MENTIQALSQDILEVQESEVRAVSHIQTRQYEKPKWTRKSILKVRTGCITCKTRHIKCDETKPHCNKCLRSRRQCEGYVDSKKVSGPAQICWDSKQNTQQSTPHTKLQQDMRVIDFHDGLGMLYFEEFVNLVRGPWISAVSNAELWVWSLPQLARSNSTLRFIATGIGALSVNYDQIYSSDTPKRLMLAGSNVDSATHYENAVRYYCRAVAILSKSNDIQDVVCSSILLLFFELLRGNRKTALNHLNHGLSLMLSLLTDDPLNYLHAVAPNPKSFVVPLTKILAILAPQARFLLVGPVGQCRPLPNFVNGLESRKLSMESFIVMLGQKSRRAAINVCPSKFNNLEEFEEYWWDVRSRNFAVGPMAMEIVQNSGVLGSKDGGIIDNFYDHLLSNSDIQRFCDLSRDEMNTLSSASLPLFNQIFMSDPQSPTYIKAIHLRLQFLQVYAFENPPQYFSAETLHLQTPLFREYLSLAKIALNIAKQKIPNFSCHISLECGIAWHLLLIAFFCRDPSTRHEAVQTLKDYPCHDGLWNVQSLYILALRNQDVERANAIDGSSTEQWHRLWRREYVFEDGGNRIVFRYQDKSDDTGDWGTVEEFADVSEETAATAWIRRPRSGFGALIMGDLTPSKHQSLGPDESVSNIPSGL